MTLALLALAGALLVAPVRGRLAAAPRPVRLRTGRWRPVAALAAVLGAGLVLPAGAVTAAVVVGGTVVLRARRASARRRRTAEVAALGVALDVLAGDLRAGAHPVAAFETAAAEVPADVARALRSVAARARLGVDVGVGLRSAAIGSAVPRYWDRLAVCWEMAHRHGLGIAVLIRAAHRDLVERSRFESRVSAGMAGARATAGVLAALPAVGVAMGQLIGAEPVRFLLSDGPGGWLLAIGATLSCGGLLWSDHITGRTST